MERFAHGAKVRHTPSHAALSAPAATALTFTGERFAPEVTGAIWHEHWHRYCLVQPLARGLAVLDAACGEGYGSYLLARGAREVVGIDIAAEAIAHARSRYAAANLRYVEGSCTALPLADASIDLVVSFETIEHLREQQEMLAEFRRVLAPGGVLVISSPNAPIYSEGGKNANHFHVRELTRDELASLLTPLFAQQHWYCQRIVAHSAFWAEAADPAARRMGSMLALVGDDIEAKAEPAPPMYFVVVCGADGVALPRLPELSLFDDGRQSLYLDYTRALLRERQLCWEELDARKVAEERLAELIGTVNDLADERRTSAALASRVTALEEAQRTFQRDLDGAHAALAGVRTERDEARTALDHAHDRLGAAAAELAAARGELAGTKSKLAAIEVELARQRGALAEVQSRLAYRETVAGWLRWPLARLKFRLRAAA
jgi:ubiquinone/menaquinone biosynthesis C-methylase UbiE